MRKRFTADDSYSQNVAKRLFGVILESGAFGLSYCTVYVNKCRQKSPTHFRQWCLALFPYQYWQLGWHKALTIHIFSSKAVWYEILFWAVRIWTLNAVEYLPDEFFKLLSSKLCDKINDRQQYKILLVLRDTIHSGKSQLENRWGNLLKWLWRWVAPEDMEQRNSQSTTASAQTSGHADTVVGARTVQRKHDTQYVMNPFIFRA